MRSGRTELATLVVTILTLFVPGVAPSLALGAPGAELGAEDSEVVETHREEEDPTGDQSDDTSPTGGQGDDASPAGDQGDDTEADTVPVAPEPVILDSETIPAGSPYIELEDLEVRMVEQALTTLGRTPEHDPWNRVVCTIDVMAYPIFLPEDRKSVV